jgi:hypothetical protein
MAGRALLTWEAAITALENDASLKRYAKCAKEPAALFERIGEDLGSSNEEVRECGWRALLVAMPKLTSIVYERETWAPGWRDVEGKDQQMVNRGEDILTLLHRIFVVEHYFKIRGDRGKDPRPLVNEIVENRRKDTKRKREREELLDHEAIFKIRDPAPSPEDIVLENDAYDGWKREFRRIVRSDDELDLFITVHVDAAPLAEVLKSNGIPSKRALDKRFSRARKQAVERRDDLLIYLLVALPDFPLRGKLPPFFSLPWKNSRSGRLSIKSVEFYRELVKLSVHPGVWLNGKAPGGKTAFAARPLTRGLRDAPSSLYLVAAHKEHPPIAFMPPVFEPYMNLPDVPSGHTQQCINKVICPTKDPDDTIFEYRLIQEYSTEVAGFNKALADVPDDYSTWLVSYFGSKWLL